MRAKFFLTVCLLSFLISTAFANTYPPKPNAYFIGDANGDTGVTGADIVQHYNYILSKAYTYDTLQPNNGVQAWNTCDMNSDRGCTGADTVILNSFLLSKAVTVTDDPWSLDNINLPLSGNATATWIPFNIDLHSTHDTQGLSGRPGVSIVVEIDPALSVGTGQLSGRECNPVAGSRDQATATNAQCALAVSQTNWPVSADTGPTESGTYGLQVMGDGNGDLNLKIYTVAIPGLDIPAASTRLAVSFGPVESVALTCPASANEDASSSCTITASGGSSCAIGAATTCTGATITDCTQIDIAAQGESSGPGSCIIEVTKGTASDLKTITINEVNANPVITSICAVSASEAVVYDCNLTATDADVPAQTLTWSKAGADTCDGTVSGTTYTWTPSEAQGGDNCTVAVQVADNFATPGTAIQYTSVTIAETNQNPVITSTCPTPALEDVDYSCSLTATDADTPTQTLTWSKISGTDTCGGAVVGSTYANWTPSEAQGGTNCVIAVEVADGNGGFATQSATLEIAETNQNPVITSTCAVSATEGMPYTCDLTAADADIPAQTLTWSVAALDTCGGTISGSAYTWTPTEAQGGAGTCVVGIQVADNFSTPGTATQNTIVTVNEINENPVITSTCATTASEGVAYSCSLTATDADLPSQTMTWSKIMGTDTCGGTISGSTYNWTPTEAQGGGTCVIAIQLTDGNGGLATQDTTVTVTETNQNPIITSNCPATAPEGVPYTCSLTATDADIPAQTLTWSKIGTDTCGGTVTDSTYGNWTPTETQGGTNCVVAVEVADGNGGLATRSTTVNITETNQNPVIISMCAVGASEGVAYYCNLAATDADVPAQSLTWSKPGADTCGGTVSGTTYIWTPSENQGGDSCTIAVQVADNFLTPGTATQYTTVAVNEKNQLPVITSTCPTIAADAVPYACNLTATDADIPAQTLTWSKPGTDTCGGTVTGSTYNWTPIETQVGTNCVVAVQVADNWATPGTATQSTTVAVLETNVSPTIVVSCGSAAEDMAGSCSILVGDADVPPDTLTCSLDITTTCAGVTLTGCTTADVPAQGEGGARSCTVEVTVDDNTGLLNATATDSSGFTITDVNVQPTISVSCGTATEDAAGSCGITVGDGDFPADTLTCSLDAATTCSGVTLTGCTIANVPAQGEAAGPGSCVVAVTVSDGFIPTPGTATGQSTLTITEVNQNPTITNLPATKASPITWSNTYDVDATDPDIPADSLTYIMDSTTCSFTPTVNGSSGVVSWTCGELPENCVVDVAALDDGIPAAPALSDTETLTIDCNTSPALVGSYNTPGYAFGVYVSGQYAYVADGTSGLQVFDITNPASPTLTGTYNTPGDAFGVYISGQYAYVTDYMSGLQIIDISDPAAPTLTGTYDTPGGAMGIFVSGQYAYVSDDPSGLQIIDISNPAVPTLTGTYDTPGGATGIFVNGQYAYVTDGYSGLQIIDITNPAAPTLSGTYNTPGYARGVYISGQYAYVSDDTYGLQIIDISDPATPTLKGTYNTPGYAQGVYVSGQYAYVADNTSGLQIIDISNPAVPTLTGSYDTPGEARCVYISGQYAYVADYTSGLQIIEFPFPVQPTLKSSYNTSGLALDVYVSGQYAYVADYDYGLLIFDITNPASPTLTGSYDTPGYARGVYISGQYAYVGDDTYGLQIIDISDPAAPILTGTYNTTGNAHGVYVSGQYAYVTDYGSGLQIINISIPAAPTLSGTYNTPGLGRGVYVSGQYAYVADGTYGLQIIDITNPTAPTLTGSYDSSGTAYGVYISGQYAYVGDGTSGLQIFDISDPAAPTLTGTYDTPGSAYGVYVSGQYAYVTDYGSGLQIIDITNPAVPTLKGSYDTTGTAYDVYVSGQFAYVADYGYGLKVIRIAYP